MKNDKYIPLSELGIIVENRPSSILRLHTGCRESSDLFIGMKVDHSIFVEFNGRYFELNRACLIRLAEEAGLFEKDDIA